MEGRKEENEEEDDVFFLNETEEDDVMKSHLEEDPKECLRDLSGLAGVHEQRCFLLVQPSCSFAARRRRHQQHGNKGAAQEGPCLLLGSHARFPARCYLAAKHTN